MKKILSLIGAAAVLFCGCGKLSKNKPNGTGQPAEVLADIPLRQMVDSTELQFSAPKRDNPVAIIETSAGTVYAILYPEYAPLAVANFCTMAKRGYYNNTPFYRTVPGFMVQAGNNSENSIQNDTASGSPFPTEPSLRLRHYSGALCTVSSGISSNQNSSHFYIMTAPQNGLPETAVEKMQQAAWAPSVIETYQAAGGAPYLDFTDTVFGQVYDGMQALDQIAAGALDKNGNPVSPIHILSVTITSLEATIIPGFSAHNPADSSHP